MRKISKSRHLDYVNISSIVIQPVWKCGCCSSKYTHHENTTHHSKRSSLSDKTICKKGSSEFVKRVLESKWWFKSYRISFVGCVWSNMLFKYLVYRILFLENEFCR